MKLNQMIKSIVLIPGSGEYVYAVTQANQGVKLAISNLRHQFPNVKDISIAVSWYATSLDAKNSYVLPLKLDNHQKQGFSEWKVAEFSRDKAQRVCFTKDNTPCSGGTPSDSSVIDVVKFLYAQSYKLTFMPLLLVNTANNDWRGSIAPDSPQAVTNFFQINGYNKYILHYATLKDGSGQSLITYFENFIIGSELVGLTTYRDFGNEMFNGVKELINLATKVKELSPHTQISYSANGLGEYHHTSGGLYALDDLWCNKNIDFIGISVYFSLSQKGEKGTILDAFNGFTSGDQADYYMSGNQKVYFDGPTCGAKNMKHWWSNFHYENGQKTCFIPESKPIYILEFGFSSSQFALQRPEAFPSTQDVKTGKFIVDNNLQQTGICATLLFFNSQSFIKKSFLYAFDARPYQEFVTQKKYADHILFHSGHWFNNKGMEHFECALVGSNYDENDL
jgi:hypothetical protein